MKQRQQHNKLSSLPRFKAAGIQNFIIGIKMGHGCWLSSWKVDFRVQIKTPIGPGEKKVP